MARTSFLRDLADVVATRRFDSARIDDCRDDPRRDLAATPVVMRHQFAVKNLIAGRRLR